MRTYRKAQSIMMVLCMALGLSACSESKSDEPVGPEKPSGPVNPENPIIPTLTEEEASVDLAELMARCLTLGIVPEADCNDFGRLWLLMETLS